MQYTAYGDPSRLAPAEVERPVPADGEILIRVRAASVNPIDWKLHDGSLRFLVPVRFPSIPGFDVAGEVVERGAGVDRFAIGDRVIACLPGRRGGACAEYAAFDASVAAPMPSTLDACQAAALPLAALTALQGLRDLAGLSAGQRLLVVGASGGVGHYAVQLGKILGAHVTAVCSTPNVEWVAALGADRVIDYTTASDFGTGPVYDAVLDCVVGASFGLFQPVMSRHGVYVSVLFPPRLLLRSLWLRLFSKQRIRFVLCRPDGEDLSRISTWVDEGRLRPVIDRIVSLSELAAAHRYSRSGRARGKIVVDVGGCGG